MFCPQCGKEVRDDSKFCSKCGSNIINFENIDKSSSQEYVPSSKRYDVKEEIHRDIKNEPVSSPKTKWILDNPIFKLIFKKKSKPSEPNKIVKFLDTPVFTSIFKDKESSSQKIVKKYGWGWFILLMFYTNICVNSKGDKVYPTSLILFLGYFGVLALYFKIRSYLFLHYHDDYKFSLISGIISLVLTFFLVGFISQIIIRFT